jgi:FKBP-type peptidyl-prolyl cis-trans isomerase SlpA
MSVFVNGAMVESTRDGGPEEVTVGGDDLVSRVDEALVGRRAGDRFEVPISAAEQCFGALDPALVQALRMSDFDPDQRFALNSLVEFTMPDGEPVAGRIVETGNDTVTVDFNHPLAGRDVLFEIEVVAIESGRAAGGSRRNP